ncbi:MAG: ADP-ribosylation factor-like protein [Amphiamblys sp. WSBS2006]|nr:MAG: ADP-ribosylation factor-like protein [Amphiamblys sp. WSBS2006]
MGSIFSRIFDRLWSDREYRMLILGLDGAGKTTVFYRLQLGESAQNIPTIPTVGFNVESMSIRNVKFQIWDLGGQTSIRPYWRCYYTNTDALVYIVDSSDRDRIETSAAELALMLEEEDIKHVSLLVLANKADIPDSMTAAEISKALHLSSIKDREWTIRQVSALSGEGVVEAFDWIIGRMQKK